MGQYTIPSFMIEPFPTKMVLHRLRHKVSRLAEDLRKDRELSNMLLQSKVEIEHLILTKSKRQEDHKAAAAALKNAKKKIKGYFDELIDDYRDEIRTIEGIDYRGQTVAFRAMKSIKKFESGVMRNLDIMERHSLSQHKKDVKKTDAIKILYDEARRHVKEALEMLDIRASGALKRLWEMAKRQSIQGIETEAMPSSQDEDKELRVIKAEAVDIKKLLGEQKGAIKLMNAAARKGDIHEFTLGVKKLIQLYLTEVHDVEIMITELRLFVFDLHGKLARIEKFAKSESLHESEVKNLEQSLREALGQLETLYNWIYHASEKKVWIKGKDIIVRLQNERAQTGHGVHNNV